jgi:hypothetical protein
MAAGRRAQRYVAAAPAMTPPPPGRVRCLAPLMVMLTDGAERLRGLASLRDQPRLGRSPRPNRQAGGRDRHGHGRWVLASQLCVQIPLCGPSA